MCLHIVAALLRLESKEKTVQKETKKLSKEAPAVLLLRQVEEEPLKAWLKEILLLQKDLHMAFLQHFSTEKRNYQKGDADRITQEAIKSVIRGNKKKVEISELKKIVDLWKKVHVPIMEQYLSEPTLASNFQLVEELLTACNSFNFGLLTNSNKIVKYIAGLQDQIAHHLAILPDCTFAKALFYYLYHFLSRKTADAIFLDIIEMVF